MYPSRRPILKINRIESYLHNILQVLYFSWAESAPIPTSHTTSDEIVARDKTIPNTSHACCFQWFTARDNSTKCWHKCSWFTTSEIPLNLIHQLCRPPDHEFWYSKEKVHHAWAIDSCIGGSYIPIMSQSPQTLIGLCLGSSVQGAAWCPISRELKKNFPCPSGVSKNQGLHNDTNMATKSKISKLCYKGSSNVQQGISNIVFFAM